MDHFAVWLIESGEMSVNNGVTQQQCRAGDLWISDSTLPLDMQIPSPCPQAEWSILWIPRSRMLSAFADDQALHGLILRQNSASGAMLGASMRVLIERTALASRAEFDTLASGLLELAAKVMAPAIEAAAHYPATPSAPFLTIRRFIDKNLGSPELDPDLLARQFGLSRSTLYRLFEPVGGIADYIRRQRLARAWREITAPGQSNQRIGLLGFRLGFTNASAFTRLFREHFGMSPGEARKMASQKPCAAPIDVPGVSNLGSVLARLGPG